MFKLFLLVFLAIQTSAFAYQVFGIPRMNGSKIQFYLETPAQKDFPVVFYIHGSTCRSVLPMFQKVAQALSAKGVGVISVEKYGLNQDTTECPKEYLEHNTITSRIQDHLRVTAYLRWRLKSWNQKVAWVGGSEGGQLAALVAPLVRETAMVVMMGSGGGLTMAEELPIAFEKLLKRKGAGPTHIQKMKWELEDQYKMIKAHPTPYKEWLSDGKSARNTYKYWNSILWAKVLPSLESLDVPILMVHGTEDTSCPIESADILNTRFQFLGKYNLTYRKYQGLEHNWSDLYGNSHLQRVMNDTFSWVLQTLRK